MKRLTIKLKEQTFQWLSKQAESECRSISGQARFFLNEKCQTKGDKKEGPDPEIVESEGVRDE